jgi:hypothetical protein
VIDERTFGEHLLAFPSAESPALYGHVFASLRLTT